MSRAERGDGRAGGALVPVLNVIEATMAVFAYVGISLLLIAIGLVVADIIGRRLMGGAVIGVIDITQLCVMAAAFWSIPYAFTKHAHVIVDVLSVGLGRRVRLTLDGFAAILSIALMLSLLYLSWGRAQEQLLYGDSSQDLGIPMIWYWSFLLSGLVLAGVAAAAAFVRDAVGPADSEGAA